MYIKNRRNSSKLEYKYPDKLENDIRKYLAGLKPKT